MTTQLKHRDVIQEAEVLAQRVRTYLNETNAGPRTQGHLEAMKVVLLMDIHDVLRDIRDNHGAGVPADLADALAPSILYATRAELEALLTGLLRRHTGADEELLADAIVSVLISEGVISLG